MSAEFSFEASGALLLTGAYALLEPRGMGVALPWPGRVKVSARAVEHWRLTVIDATGTREDHVSALAEVAEGALPEFRPRELTLDFGDDPATSTSAILALALAREAASPDGQDDWNAVQGSALALHRTLQSGLGSGYDVLVAGLRRAALLERPPEDPEDERPAPLKHRKLDLSFAPEPPGTGEAFHVLVGQHRSRVPTRHLLRAYRANSARAQDTVDELVSESRQIATEVARAIEGGKIALLRSIFADLPHVHAMLQRLVDGNYINDTGRAGLDAARELVIAATPSGASADTLAAFERDPEKLGRLETAWSRLGYSVSRFSGTAGRS